MGVSALLRYLRKEKYSENENSMKTMHKITIGDARKIAEVRDESVQLIVTSLPYWQLKDYGDKRQIGFDDSYEDNQLMN